MTIKEINNITSKALKDMEIPQNLDSTARARYPVAVQVVALAQVLTDAGYGDIPITKT